MFFFPLILGPNLTRPKMSPCSRNSFGATIVMLSEFFFSAKIIKIHELHVYTRWEQQIEEARFTTTTPDDGKTAAALTFFFYRRHLSRVPSGKPIFSRRSQVGRRWLQGVTLSFVARPL